MFGDGDVVGAVYSKQWPGRGESNATVLLRGKSAAGIIQSGWLEPSRFQLNLVGTSGTLSYDYDRPTELLKIGADGTREVVAVVSHEPRFDEQLTSFARFARGGARSGLATFEDGLRVAQLVDAAAKANII
jgi:predicted dehydrogenase